MGRALPRRIYRRLVVPLWEALTPWALPAALVAVVASCALRLAADVRAAREAAPTADAAAMALARLYCGIAAAVSALVLVVHATGRMCLSDQPDPLRHAPLSVLLRGTSTALSAPWLLLRRLIFWARLYLLSPVLSCMWNVLVALGRFAIEVSCLRREWLRCPPPPLPNSYCQLRSRRLLPTSPARVLSQGPGATNPSASGTGERASDGDATGRGAGKGQ